MDARVIDFFVVASFVLFLGEFTHRARDSRPAIISERAREQSSLALFPADNQRKLILSLEVQSQSFSVNYARKCQIDHRSLAFSVHSIRFLSSSARDFDGRGNGIVIRSFRCRRVVSVYSWVGDLDAG